MNNKRSYFKNPILWFVAKLITGTISLVVIGIIILIVYFNYNKENISRNILSIINSNISGQIDFKDITLSPLAQFPRFSISMEDVSYDEIVHYSDDTIKSNILKLEHIHFAFNVISLFTKDVSIYGVLLEEGSINIIRSNDSTLNIVNAFQLKEKKESEPSDTVAHSSTPIKNIRLSLDFLTLRNIDVSYIDSISNSSSNITIEKVYASYQGKEDTVALKLESKLYLKKLGIYDISEISDSKLELDADLAFAVADSILTVNRANIKLDDTKFISNGKVELGSKKNLDLNIYINDKELSIVNYLLDKGGIENIEQGSVFFDGRITHNFKNQIPSVACKFGVKNIKITDPVSGNFVDSLNISGLFKSGKTKDLSSAKLIIDTIYGSTNDGKFNASMSLRNFASPEVQAKGNLNINLLGLDDILGLKIVENIRGNVKLDFDISGSKTNDSTWVFTDDRFNIQLEGIGVEVPEMLTVSKLEGTVSGTLDNFQISELGIVAGNTDLLIDGNILNLTNLINGGFNVPEARLKIKGSRFDLPETMEWIPTMRDDFREQFPYSFINIDLEAHATITKEAILNSTIMPEMHIDVPYCKAQIDEFLPPVEVSNGYLHFKEEGSGYYIAINDFDILFEEAKLIGGCTYYDKSGEYDSLVIVANIGSLNPDYILNYYSKDTTSILDSMDISGHANIQMNFSGFDTVRENSFASIHIDELEIKQPNDTIQCESLKLDIGNVYYNTEALRGPLSVLSANILLSLDNLSASNADLDNLSTEIIIEEGEFDVIILASSSLLQGGKGKLIFAPFAEIPYFHLNYSLDKFRFESLFERLNQPPAINGDLGISMTLDGKGKDRMSFLESLDGNVNFHGNELKLYGLNLDNIIRKLNRTQNFSLVDIGAVIVAGPVGLLVTKGADLSSLLINNRKDSTEIVQLLSEWSINKGIMELSDVAFSTPKNRIAIKGKYSFPTDSIGMLIAVVDEQGKIELHQTVSGTSRNPDFGEIRPLKTLLAPVSNLLDDVFFIKGETFYDGQVVAPGDQKHE